MPPSDLGRRLAVAGPGIPLGILVIYWGGWALGGVLAVVAALAAHEFFALVRDGRGRPFTWVGVVAAALLVLLATLEPFYLGFAPAAFALVVAATLAMFLAAVWLRGSDGEPIGSVSTTVAGTIYVGGGLSFVLLLRHLPETGAGVRSVGAWEGALLLIFPLAITWMGDTAAYLAGNWWGKRKLIPTVSPGKTVTGGIAGLVGAIATGTVFVAVAPAPFAPWGVGPGVAAVIALVVGLGAQVGDLAVSVLKREAGVKDTGRLLPGHGGALDRFDGVLVTVPITYVALLITGALL